MLKELKVSAAPHISGPFSTRGMMLDVIIALVPAMIAAGIYFRHYAFILLFSCIVTALVAEWLCNVVRRRANSLGDFSSVVTAIILALSLPPTVPFWAAAIGTAFAIIIGKMVFGGLGANIFNPAMVGRAFLVASFGVMMTTWTVPATIQRQMPAVSPENQINARTQATPLAWSKEAIKSHQDAKKTNNLTTAAFWGEVGGCLGETSTVALIIGGVYLLIRRTISIHIPLSVLGSAFVLAGIAYLIDGCRFASPMFHITAGGLMLGAFFIATDPVTSPMSVKGMWIFGIGVGAVTMLIRIVGGYPEGVMFSILLMNSVSPLIDRMCKAVPAGGPPRQ